MTDPADSPITILTADDHPLIRDGLAAVLRAESGLQVVAEAANGEEAIEAYARLHPAIVLMDLRMPLIDSLTATRAILADDPNARIIVLTTYNGDEDIHRALAAGARGYLLKDMMRTDLLGVIRAVHRGQRGIPAQSRAVSPSIRRGSDSRRASSRCSALWRMGSATRQSGSGSVGPRGR